MQAHIKNLERKADRLIQEVSKLVWLSRCSWCRVFTDDGSGHHLIGRRSKLVRHNPINVPYVCLECHNKIHSEPYAEEEYMGHLAFKFPAVFKWYINNKNPESPFLSYESQLEGSIESLRDLLFSLAGSVSN